MAARVISAGCLAFLGAAALATITATAQQLAAGGPNARLVCTLVINLCIFLLMLMEATLVVCRPRALAKASGVQARVCALAGTWLIYLVILLPARTDLPTPIYLVAAALSTLGDLLTMYVLLSLGGAFSIMAEARQLVERGPYAIVRHPLYVTEEVALAGAVINYLSWQAATLLALQMFFQYLRARNEERVLAGTLPGYAAYMRRTPMWLPLLKSPRP